MLKIFGFILAVLVISLAIYMFLWQLKNPRTILEYGEITVKSRYSPYKIDKAKTRKVSRGGQVFWEVQVTSKGWIACGTSCEETYRREVTDLWETQQYQD